MSQNHISIIDAPCGSGKTTAMIDGFMPEKKYLVVVPYLSEADRIISSSKLVPFQQPSDEAAHSTKSESIEALLLEGANIATTHNLYSSIVHMVRQGLLDDYHIIIDEVPDVCEQVRDKNPRSINEFYLKNGYITVDGDGLVRATQKWDDLHQEVADTLDTKIYHYAKSGCLYLLKSSLFIWAIPLDLMTAGQSVTIMTYMAQGSMLMAYLKKFNIPCEIIKDKPAEVAFKGMAREQITVKSIASLERMSLSWSGQTSSVGATKRHRKVSTALKNLRGRDLVGIDQQHIMLTCVKSLWFQRGDSACRRPRPAGFSKDSKLFQCHWLANTTRGTNQYSHCSHLIYLYDKHLHSFIKAWLGMDSSAQNDAYALAELVQWVWRSRIRKGEPITLYLPSERMRRLFLNWLDEAEAMPLAA